MLEQSDHVQATLIQRVVSEMLPFKVEKVIRPELEIAKAKSANLLGSPSEFSREEEEPVEEEGFLFERSSASEEPFDFISSSSRDLFQSNISFFQDVTSDDLVDLFLR